MATLSGRLRRYSEKCVSDRLDENFAKAVQEAANLIEERIEYPETNADRIRSMTDAELAEWFGMSERMCPDGFSETIDCDACPEVCTGHWLLWLKEEVKQ